MLKDIVDSVEAGMASLMSLLKFHINDYCDLETTEGNALVAVDGSMATVLRYHGFRSLIGKAEYQTFARELANGLEQFMGKRGYKIQIVFTRDDDPSAEIDHILEPSYESARRMQMTFEDILDEKKEVMRRFCMDEKVYIVLWTRPTAMDPVELKLALQESHKLKLASKMPPMATAQNILRPIPTLGDRHEAFVQKFIHDVTLLHGFVEELDVRQALCEMKRYLYASTPHTWRPVLVGDPLIGRWKNNRKRDVSEAMYYRLDDQLFSAPAVQGNRKGEGGVTDTKGVRLGSRVFAPVMVKVPPQRLQSFTSLFGALNNAGTKGADGRARPMPWSISFLLEGDGLKGVMMRKIFAGILAWTSQSNRNLVKAVEALARYKNNQNGAVVKMQITAVTWVDHGQENELLRRRNKLSSALQGWGNASVEEETGDATAALISTAPALSLSSPAVAAAPPLHEVTYMLPLSRPASPFGRGSTVLRTLDGKLLTYEMFSDQQNTWLSLIFGGPGSGKSVLANRLNEEMCILPGLVRLPYIQVIDIGISSSGFISLVQDSLPDDKKHLAQYIRIQNTANYRINQFDTQLGQRFPLPRERESMRNFLVRLATPPERGRTHAYMNEFAGRVLDEAFRRLSDTHERGNAKVFSLATDPFIRERVQSAGIDFTEATKWWEIVDAFFERGMIHEATCAQRYAQPILFDLLNVASDPNIMREFETATDDRIPVADEFKLMLTTAQGDFPVFNGHTVFDIGETRVMAFDLQDVVSSGSNAARKQASLMYMVALNAFMRKVGVIKEDLEVISPKYKDYHAKRIDELQEDYKRIFCDEYHKTGGDVSLRESFLIYGRESRKWLLEIVLASQLPKDFAELAQLATTILIMDNGNEQTRDQIATIFGLSETEAAALRKFVNGAQPGIGATFLGKFKTKTAELSQLFTATSGGLELWGLSTTAEDRVLRSALYSRMPSQDARRILKRRFPSGSCKSYVMRQKANAKAAGEGFVDDERMQSLLEVLADELTQEWREQQAENAVPAVQAA